MITGLKYVTIAVADPDEALAWYTGVLGLELRMDRQVGKERWLSVGIPGVAFPEIALQYPSPEVYDAATLERKRAQIGMGTTWVLAVKDCRAYVETLRARGVDIMGEPDTKPWGTSALIRDRYGNVFNLVEPA